MIHVQDSQVNDSMYYLLTIIYKDMRIVYENAIGLRYVLLKQLILKEHV